MFWPRTLQQIIRLAYFLTPPLSSSLHRRHGRAAEGGQQHQQVLVGLGQRHQCPSLGPHPLCALSGLAPDVLAAVRVEICLFFPSLLLLLPAATTGRARASRGSPSLTPRLPSLLPPFSDSLGGNAKTFLVACTSPNDENFAETLSTLKFAQRAKMVRSSCVCDFVCVWLGRRIGRTNA